VLDLEKLWEWGAMVMLAVAGGLAKILHTKERRRKLSRVLAELFVSGFAGIMIFMFARAITISGEWIGILCGLAGWSGPKAVDALSQTAGKRVGLDFGRENEGQK